MVPKLMAVPVGDGLRVRDRTGAVTVTVGGKRDRRFCQPLCVTGRVLCITAGPIHDQSKTGDDPTVEAGTVICLAIDNVRLVLTEKLFHTGLGPQPSLYRKVGIEPFDAKIVQKFTNMLLLHIYLNLNLSLRKNI